MRALVDFGFLRRESAQLLQPCTVALQCGVPSQRLTATEASSTCQIAECNRNGFKSLARLLCRLCASLGLVRCSHACSKPNSRSACYLASAMSRRAAATNQRITGCSTFQYVILRILPTSRVSERCMHARQRVHDRICCSMLLNVNGGCKRGCINDKATLGRGACRVTQCAALRCLAQLLAKSLCALQVHVYL